MKRFIHSNNGTLVDKSVVLENYHSGSYVIDYVAAEDAIFIGSELPFNSIYTDVSVANDKPSVANVAYWDGSDWRDAVEVIDETVTNGATYSVSGNLTWVPDRNYSWAGDDTVDTSGNETITGLGNVTIYNLYWIKITYSNDFNALTDIDWLGQKFCNTNDVIGEYVLFANTSFMSSYETGKTDWAKEIVLASRILTDDIINKGSIISGDQLLVRRKLRDVCVSKVDEIIFKNLGDDYKDDYTRAANEYKTRISRNNYGADKNRNGMVDPSEQGVQTGVLFR